MSDPRQEERLRLEAQPLRGLAKDELPTQVMERIRLRLSPSDDGLPFAQAVRNKEEMDKAAVAFSKRTKKKRPHDG